MFLFFKKDVMLGRVFVSGTFGYTLVMQQLCAESCEIPQQLFVPSHYLVMAIFLNQKPKSTNTELVSLSARVIYICQTLILER